MLNWNSRNNVLTDWSFVKQFKARKGRNAPGVDLGKITETSSDAIFSTLGHSEAAAHNP